MIKHKITHKGAVNKQEHTKGRGERGRGEAYPHDLWDKGLESGEGGRKRSEWNNCVPSSVLDEFVVF